MVGRQALTCLPPDIATKRYKTLRYYTMKVDHLALTYGVSSGNVQFCLRSSLPRYP
jgi:hypothetical protein